MNRSVYLACLVAVATASPLLVSTASAAPPARSYTVTEVDYGRPAKGIDNLGDYVAGSYLGDYALVYGNGGGTSLPYPSGFTLAPGLRVQGISDRGVTAGSYNRYDSSGPGEPFYGRAALTWTRVGEVTTLPTPPATESQAADANDRGAVVGCIGKQFAYLPDGNPTDQCVATVWRNGKAVPLGPVGSEATLVNNAGTIVGAVGGVGPRHAVVFTGRGSYRPLRELPGTTASEATALNGNGAIVGVSTIAGSPVPTFWDGRGRAHRLSGTALPVGINDLGTIAGNDGDRAVLWPRRTATPKPLPTLAYKGEDGVVYQYPGTAVGINDRGTVIGNLSRPERPGSDFNTRSISTVVRWIRT